MQLLKHMWHLFVAESFLWLFSYLFQPITFKNTFDGIGLGRRFIVMLRLTLPLFLCSLLMIMPSRLLLYFLLPRFYIASYGGIGPFVINTLVETMYAAALGIIGTFVSVFIVNVSSTITLCIAVSLIAGITINTRTLPGPALQVLLIVGITYGIATGLFSGLTAEGSQRAGMSHNIRIVIGRIVGSLLGIVTGILPGFFIGLFLGWFGRWNTPDEAAIAAGGIVGAIAVASLGSLIKSLTREAQGSLLGAIAAGRSAGIFLSILMGMLGGDVGVITFNRDLSPLQGAGYSISFSFAGPVAASMFLVSYLCGYYRLPLYPIAVLSAQRAYRRSRKKPAEIFRHIHSSALYWDERILLPFLHLKDMLLIAASQDLQSTLQEITFIVAERPDQIFEARRASILIIFVDLERRQTLQEIAEASRNIDMFLLPELRQTNERWMHSLTRLNDASRNAALFCSAVSRQIRQKALDEMIVSLNNVRPYGAFEDAKLNRQIRAVVKQWMVVALQEVDNLKRGLSHIGEVDNPYISGPSLKLNDRSFVGRLDLVRQLEQSLSKGRDRPTFFLTGERRMGKTSTLNQLPRLLSARYLPIYYDLQRRDISSNSAACLSTIMEGIFQAMTARGLMVRKLEYAALNEARRENAAAPYRLFDEWLRELENILVREDLTILLTFDEFEKLQEAGDAHFLDLSLLLDWFRSVIQNRPRIALLFSGVLGLGEMGIRWAGYFVNTQVLKVGTLQADEARHLVMYPEPHYPAEQIFGEGVVEEILNMAGGHPFLIQAVCSKLVDLLNIDNRGSAQLDDVAVAVQQVFESWGDTYFQDLWNRTCPLQRRCLSVLLQHREATLQQIIEQSQLDERTVRDILKLLVRRDLILYEQDYYRFSIPVFQFWVQYYG
jgi:hypothetical protein